MVRSSRRAKDSASPLHARLGLVIVLVLIGFGVVVSYGPSFTGLAVADDQTAVLSVDRSFTETGSTGVRFAALPTSVKASGSAIGQGVVTLRMLSGTDSYLIGQVTVDGQETFSELCDQTCTSALSFAEGVVDVEIDGNVGVTLDSLSYTFVDTNSEPAFIGRTNSFVVRKNEALTLNLANYFFDVDSDPLTYVVTADESFTIDLSVDQLTVTPAEDYVGVGEIVIFVSDLTHTVRVPLVLEVALVDTYTMQSMNAPSEVTPDILAELDLVDELDVIVVMKDDPAMNPPLSFGTATVREKEEFLWQRKKAIEAQTNSVLSTLNLDSYEGRGFTGMLSAANAVNIDFRLKNTYGTVPAFAGRITKQGYEKLVNDPRVVRIVRDLSVKLNTNTSIAHARADFVRNMTLLGMNLNGSGLSACVIDSGIDNTHPDFGSRILNETCFCAISDLGSGGCCSDATATADNATDDYGHGTLVAGIIASQNETFPGIAPGAGIVAVKAFNASGDALISDITLSVDYCISNSTIFNISTIQLSFGTNRIGPVSTVFDGSSAGFNNADICDNLSSSATTLTSQLNLAAGLGIVPVASTGNDGFFTGISYPACMSNVTAISALNDADDSIPSFANDAALNDGWAGGVNICAARANNTNLSGNAALECDPAENLHISANGTSFSAPHVAGGVLILKQIIDKEGLENLTVNQIRELLNTSDTFITDSFNAVTRPRFSLVSMVAKLARNLTLNVTASQISNGNGLIDYTSTISLSQLLSCINISPNLIQINNSNNCVDFNTTAAITINDVFNLSTPRILLDGQPCPGSICSGLSSNATAVTFTTSQAGNFTAQDALQVIDSCGELGTASTVYQLNASVASNFTCFNITASDVTLDCVGETIEYNLNGSSNVSGIFAESVERIQVRNCQVADVNSSGSSNPAIHFIGVNMSTLINGSVLTNGSAQNHGIRIEKNSHNHTIANMSILGANFFIDNYGIFLFTNVTAVQILENNITTNGTSRSNGIYVSNVSSNVNISNNTILAQGTDSATYGICLQDLESANVRLVGNEINTDGTSDAFGIRIDNTSSTLVDSNIVRANGTSTTNFGMLFANFTTDTLVRGNDISTNGTTQSHAIRLVDNSSRNSFINNTFLARGSSVTSSQLRIIDLRSGSNVFDNNLFKLQDSIGGTTTATIGIAAASANNSFYNSRIELDTIGNTVSASISCSGLNNTFVNTTIRHVSTASGALTEALGIDTANPCNASTWINTDIQVNSTALTVEGIRMRTPDLSFFSTFVNISGNNGPTGAIRLRSAPGAWNATFNFTEVAVAFANGTLIDIEVGNNTLFHNTILHLTGNWIRNEPENENNTFINTTFRTPSGEIRYQGVINISNMTQINATHLNVSANLSFVNSSLYPFLNTSAQIKLNNIGFTSPLPVVDPLDLVNFSLCNATTCQFVSFSGGLFIFNVTHFTSYAASINTSASSGGGGGGATSVPGGRGAGGNPWAARAAYDSIYRQPLGTFGGAAISPPVQPPVEKPVETPSPSISPPVIEEPVISVPPPVESFCGDGYCDRGEDSFGCPNDCGVPPPIEPADERTGFPIGAITWLFFGIAIILLLLLLALKFRDRHPPQRRPMKVMPIMPAPAKVKSSGPKIISPIKKSYNERVQELMDQIQPHPLDMSVGIVPIKRRKKDVKKTSVSKKKVVKKKSVSKKVVSKKNVSKKKTSRKKR